MNIITVVGIRPDFIRMSEIFRRLDADSSINHTLVHTGQHFDTLLSSVFFKELHIAQPTYNLNIGGPGKSHYHQTADLTVKLIELIKAEELRPDWIVFLGDSNSVLVAPSLAKEGYRIAHIEAGMRSYDRRMLEEINRIVCDHTSSLLFTYHKNYTQRLVEEGIERHTIKCVGNTIVEVAEKVKAKIGAADKTKEFILADIHRPENFQDPARLQRILVKIDMFQNYFKLPVKLLGFPRTINAIDKCGIETGAIEVCGLLSYHKYIDQLYNCKFLISDSGTAQEEAALFNTPVLVPREHTERPESYTNKCSVYMSTKPLITREELGHINQEIKADIRWLGNGTASKQIVEGLKNA